VKNIFLSYFLFIFSFSLSKVQVHVLNLSNFLANTHKHFSALLHLSYNKVPTIQANVIPNITFIRYSNYVLNISGEFIAFMKKSNILRIFLNLNQYLLCMYKK
jgi:hypothetical protein